MENVHIGWARTLQYTGTLFFLQCSANACLDHALPHTNKVHVHTCITSCEYLFIYTFHSKEGDVICVFSHVQSAVFGQQIHMCCTACYSLTACLAVQISCPYFHGEEGGQ